MFILEAIRMTVSTTLKPDLCRGIERPADHVVSRRVGRQRRCADERGSLVGQVGSAKTERKALGDVELDVEIEIIIGRDTRCKRRRIGQQIRMDHARDMTPQQGRLEVVPNVAEAGVDLPLRVRDPAADTTIAGAAGIIARGRPEQAGNLVVLQIGCRGVQLDRAGVAGQAQRIQPDMPVELCVDAGDDIRREVEQTLLTQRDLPGQRIAGDPLTKALLTE